MVKKNLVSFIRLFDNENENENERALKGSEIDFYAKKHNLKLEKSLYIGNLRFFIILQSIILRTPKWLNHLTYLPLTYFDFFFEKFKSKYALAAMIKIYRKDFLKIY